MWFVMQCSDTPLDCILSYTNDVDMNLIQNEDEANKKTQPKKKWNAEKCVRPRGCLPKINEINKNLHIEMRN